MRASDPPPAAKANGRQYAVAPGPLPATTREIPYDYVARFELKGELSNRVQDVINISVDGAFVAVAIGYSYVPATSSSGLDQLLPLIAKDPRLVQRIALRLCGFDFKYTIVDSGSGRELQNQAIHSVAGLGEPLGRRPFRPLAKPIMFMPRSTIRIEVEELADGPLYGEIGKDQTRQGKPPELYIVLHGYKVLGYGSNAA